MAKNFPKALIWILIKGFIQEKHLIDEEPGLQYGHLFFLAPSNLYAEYSIGFKKTDIPEIKTRSYCINFREICTINCKQIQHKSIGREILNSKVLQLSNENRNDLRERLKDFFGRVPKKDKICSI